LKMLMTLKTRDNALLPKMWLSCVLLTKYLLSLVTIFHCGIYTI
jgi:hypothetical protein